MKIKIGVLLRQVIPPSTISARWARTLLQLGPLAYGVIARSAPAPAESIGTLLTADPGYEIVERSQSFAVLVHHRVRRLAGDRAAAQRPARRRVGRQFPAL